MEKRKKMRRIVYAMLLLLVGCTADKVPASVRFFVRSAAYPASEWSLIGVFCKEKTPLWVRMITDGDSTLVEEWKVNFEQKTECLYLPPMAPGRYRMQASLRRGGPSLAEVSIVRSDTVLVFNCDANLFWGGEEGFLLDAVSGKPVVGAEVKLTDVEFGSLVTTLFTDSVGAYRFHGLESWREYAVNAGLQGTGILYQWDRFFRYNFFGDTVRMVGRGFSPDARLVNEEGRRVASVHFKPNDMGINEAMVVLPPKEPHYLILNQDDTVTIARTDIADEQDQYHFYQREFQEVSMDDHRLRFTVEDYSGESSRVPVHADVMRFGEPHPWRMSTRFSLPIGSSVIHHSIDSAEFARRFPYLLMDTMSRHSLSELPDLTLAASYDFKLADGDTASIGLDKLDSGSYRIILTMPLPKGDMDSVERLFYHYCTPGYRLGSGPFYAYNISGQNHAVGDTLRVKVGSCYSGVTVLCQVEVNGKVVEVKQLRFNNNETILCQPLRQRGVVQMKFLSIWHGEFDSWTARVDVGRTRLDWYWDDLYPYEMFDLSGQVIDLK